MSDIYTIDYEKAEKMGFLSELVVLKTFGAIEEVEKVVCEDCGYVSFLQSEFVIIDDGVPRVVNATLSS